MQVTLGPGGRPILLEVDNKPPLSTKDGVTVARHYRAEGDIERVVANAALEICERTVREAGDGTTTAIVLGAALVQAGQDFIAQNPGWSPQSLSRELKRIYQEQIHPQVIALSRPIKNLPVEEAKSAIRYVALVSANHDEEIADAVTQAVDYVGEDGMCVAEEGAGRETRVVHHEGFPFNSGLSDLGGGASSAFINRQDYGDCVVESSYVCLYDGDINDPTTIAPILEKVASELGEDGHPIRCPIVVFAHKFSDTVLTMLAKNFRRGTLTVVPVVTPRNGQASGKSLFLHDLAAYCGGKVFDPQGNPLPFAQIPQLGAAESVKIGRSESVMLGEPVQENVERRIEELKKQMDNTTEFDCDLIRYRIGRLTGGVATIYAGGATALEAKERHARVVDAISAVRSAMDMGVVPGGGCTLFSLAVSMMADTKKPQWIFAKALQRPFFQILENAGIEMGVTEIGQQQTGFYVYDALKREVVEWWSAGIMDPAKVTLSALENALSVAQLLMTLGGVIALEQNEETEKIKQMQEGVLKAIEGDAI